MQHKTRLLIGKVIWKGRDLLSDANGLKRNLLRKPRCRCHRQLIGSSRSLAAPENQDAFSFLPVPTFHTHTRAGTRMRNDKCEITLGRFNFTCCFLGTIRAQEESARSTMSAGGRVRNSAHRARAARLFVKAALINSL